MTKPNYNEIDLNAIKTYSINERKSKVNISEFAKCSKKGQSFSQFFDSLPNILKSKDLLALIDDIIAAINNDKPIIIMMGAHVIKCGLNPLLIRFIELGIINCIALNGAGVIHDTELAYWGNTSEDVGQALNDGSFGMVQETPATINNALSEGRKYKLGFGEAVGRKISEDEKCIYKQNSLLMNAYKHKIPITVHVAIGTDIIHQHGNSDGATIGELSHRDFKIFCNQIKDLGNGGVLLNFGSAVILPEVFLKALTVVRNLGYDTHKFSTANFDMLQHYRPRVNVLNRPTQTGGRAYQFTGHHEIMIPLLFAGIIEKMKAD